MSARDMRSQSAHQHPRRDGRGAARRSRVRLLATEASVGAGMTLGCDDGRATTGRRSEIEEFAFLVGHELRQPLASAMNLLALLEDDCENPPHESQRCRMRQLRTLIHRAAELLAAQTALASAWPRSAAPRLVSLEHLVEGALLELKTELEQATVRVEIGPLPWLRVDPSLLQQLFRNVIGNAVRYRRAGVPSQIAIHSEARDAPDPAWTIQVRDNGRGFSMDEAESLFAPFSQLEAGAGGGRGLGLALCRRIAELHGGTVTAVGRPGKGATFSVVLPRMIGGLEPVRGEEQTPVLG